MPTEPQTPPTPLPPARSRRWPHRLALAGVLVAGFALRVVYGWPDPTANRNWDARFGLPNVESIVRSGGFLPVNAYHPSLSWLPQAVALAAVDACRCLELGTGTTSVLQQGRHRPPGARSRQGGPALAAVSPLGYRTCRIVQALLGVAALALLYRIAERVLGAWRGVAAAALLAFVPWHLWTAGVCNEEAGFFLAVEVAALATLFAVRRDDLPGYATAGVAFGCALATKLNAGPVALPLAIWTLARARREPRRLVLLVAAAAVSVATFLALNPHFVTRFDLVRRDFGYTVGHYERKAAIAGTGHLDVLLSGLASPASPEYLGLPFALLALGGLAAAARRRAPAVAGASALRLQALFPLTYVAVYALVTSHIKDHNWLPVLPFAIVLALAGAGALADAARRAGGRRLAAAAIALAAAAALPVAVRGAAFVYRAVVPDTLELALHRLSRVVRHGHGIFLRDVPEDRTWVGRRASRRHLHEVEIAAGDPGLDAARLANADLWVLRRSTARSLGLEPEVVRFEIAPRAFRARGPALVAGGRPWRRLGVREAARVRESRGATAEIELALGALPPAATRISLRFGVVSVDRDSECTVRLGRAAPLPAHLELRRRAAGAVALDPAAPRALAGELFFTERLDPAGGGSVTLSCSGAGARRIAAPVELSLWAGGPRDQSTLSP